MDKKRIITVRDFDTDSVHTSFDVTGKSERHIEKLTNGLLHRIDLENFYIDDTEDHDD